MSCGKKAAHASAQERALSNDVAAMEDRLQSAARASQPAHVKASHRGAHRRSTLTDAAADDGTGGVVTEAKAYDDFLVRHGPCDGWHSDDAATFDQAFRCAHGPAAAAAVTAAC